MNLSIAPALRREDAGDAADPLEPGRAGDDGGERNGDCMADSAELLSMVKDGYRAHEPDEQK